MTSRIVAVDPFDLVVFGGTGDLAHRKLFPALFRRDHDGQLTDPTRIIGVSRKELDRDAFRAEVREALTIFVPKSELEDAALERFLDRLDYVTIDAVGDAGWDDLKTLLAEGLDRVRAFYLATSPELFDAIAHNLKKHDLISGRTRVVLEKPLGKDLASAQEINAAVGDVLDESQIYRIDHYLGKETVQNLLALRFANVLFEPVWDSAHVDHVQITVAEKIGVGSRGGYYDTSGALRDMVQNHILQLLCLVAMEPPGELNADSLRDEKLKVLRALKPIDDATVRTLTVRGQYRSGAVDGQSVPGYLEELGDGAESATETYVALKAEVRTWRWAGVPFYLRTGKRLPSQVSEIVIQFRETPLSIFGAAGGFLAPNRLVIRLQPDEGVKLYLMIKDPGPGGLRFREVPLNLSFADTFKVRNPDAYERLLMDVIRGNQTLFMRRDEVEAAWVWADPILEAWSRLGQPPAAYTAGTWGPSAAVALIERDGRTWHEEAS
ncbi:glucose-6-phosphate 1-dehydrogenase [Methylopila jiangsuensis]|uniref:Glucose-6-phosphate 1-dehydrogenase n=1 Tax=Methylopila jiangsuensis TaxID=586230 RepID=A0A9W6JHF1_9HYPH|nr:glucose-6-phosphate dehydrogenase [Methylopila jiangsuensis]MDR6286411.1 glucose-6-phosphate 1-dehydrogenase [Methylopila jiangsuensis]GLK77252.1 glucose-6-phosphate 1-dehydrogenase [Methylopila jiangsuensis]